MTATTESRKCEAEVQGSTVVLALSGDWVARTDGVDLGVVDQAIKPGVRVLRFDTVKLGHWDSGLIAVLAGLREAANKDGVAFDEDGLPGPARRILQLLSTPAAKSRPRPQTTGLDRIGLWAIAAWAEGVEDAALVGSALLRGAAALRGQAAIRAKDLVEAMYDAGLAALPIVTIVSLLVGGILAFIGATELSKFGAGVYVADLVGIGMVREMAALMTAIIMAGRTGGAYAANIASMESGEEIDALRAMGIPVAMGILPSKLPFSRKHHVSSRTQVGACSRVRQASRNFNLFIDYSNIAHRSETHRKASKGRLNCSEGRGQGFESLRVRHS